MSAPPIDSHAEGSWNSFLIDAVTQMRLVRGQKLNMIHEFNMDSVWQRWGKSRCCSEAQRLLGTGLLPHIYLSLPACLGRSSNFLTPSTCGILALMILLMDLRESQILELEESQRHLTWIIPIYKKSIKNKRLSWQHRKKYWRKHYPLCQSIPKTPGEIIILVNGEKLNPGATK